MAHVGGRGSLLTLASLCPVAGGDDPQHAAQSQEPLAAAEPQQLQQPLSASGGTPAGGEQQDAEQEAHQEQQEQAEQQGQPGEQGQEDQQDQQGTRHRRIQWPADSS